MPFLVFGHLCLLGSSDSFWRQFLRVQRFSLTASVSQGTKDPKMAPVKRYANEVDFKLKAISHTLEYGNRAVVREFNINESMVQKWRKH